MSESFLIFLFGLSASVIGTLILLILGWIVREIREMSQEIATLRESLVGNAMCKVMMSAHEKRLERLEEKTAV